MSDTSVLNPVVLQQFLRDSGVDVAGDLDVELISGGKSNLTFAVTDGVAKWVVRRPPTGGLTPSAHDMNREWAVTKGLQGTAVPVAATVAIDTDGSVLGAPCTVVEFVDGQVIRTREEVDAFDDAAVEANVGALVDTLAALHAVDYNAVGLGEFGRPDGFAARQVKLWARQWGIVKTRELADIDRLIGALTDRLPTSARNGIVHGDFRCDNTIVAADDPGRVLAV
ncbi:putative phosphotransferase, partial [Gordonia effusa NBRC 100432]